MSMFEVVLTHNQKLTITEEQKNELEKAWIESDPKIVRIKGIGHTIDVKTIKGIFDLTDKAAEKREKSGNDRVKQMNIVWSKELEALLKLSAEKRAQGDMKYRVVPLWRTMGGKREDQIMRTVYEWIIRFFEKNPEYPHCPSSHWMRLLFTLNGKEPERISRFGEILARNDFAVARWIEAQKSRPTEKQQSFI